MTTLAGKVTLVTGGSSGIGRATARLLAEHGSRIVLPYSTQADGSAAPAEAAARELRALGVDVETVEADVARLPDIARMFDVAEQRFGGIDHVVHCAAVITSKPLADCTEADYDRMFTINAKGTFFVLQQAAKRVSDGGRIVAFSSPASRQGGPGGALYCGSKAPVEGFVRCLAWEVAPRGITVNAVSPGITETPMLLDAWRERGAAMSPFNRLGQPRDVADCVYLLLLPEAQWLTGQTVFAGGGVMMG